MMNLGNIQQVSLREVWPNEARDFTPWLAENIDKLGNALGMDLEVQSAEAPVGSFSLDILAWDSGRGRPVIIENQLDTTNHDHLGKLLTYAAGYDAYAAVWLTREFRDEHRQALDWLNQRTGEDTQFFGVVVEAWQIDDSRPAPHFNVVAMPNDWRKRAISVGQQSGADGVEVSERMKLYRRFFQDLIDILREQHQFTNARIGQAQSWYAFSSGFSGVSYGAAFTQGMTATVNVSIDRGDGEWNKGIFARLMERKETIEADLGEPLVWETVENRRACRIPIRRPASIDDDPETLEDVQQWMVEHLLNFKRVFSSHLTELVR